MKKLLFILSAVLVSGMTYGASLNPYAYNLSSTWNEETQELTVRFTLNAHPNLNQHIVNGNATNSIGIQIYAIDPDDPSERYYIYGVSGAEITDHINKNKYDYECTISIDGMTKDGNVANRRPLPTGKNLTWAVTVQGKNKTNQSTPVVVKDNIANRPYSCHGVAVNNDQNSPQFGNIYVTEASEGLTNTASGNYWKWISDGAHGRSVLQYSPRLDFEKSWKKNPPFSLVQNKPSGGRVKENLMEPHRVRVSDDGRIFVSSYNILTNTEGNTGKPLVWELDTVSGTYTPIITFNHTNGYGHRVTSMAVKGSGDNLTIALCFLNITNGELRVYEYAVGNSTTATATATKLIGKYSLTNYKTNVIDNNYYSYSDGLISIAYGVKDKSRIYIGVDYFYTLATSSVIVGLNPALTSDTKQAFVYTTNSSSTPKRSYGGGGIVVYQDGDRDMVAVGGYDSTNGGRFFVYQLAANSNSVSKCMTDYTINIQTSNITNDFAIDNAYNLYTVSFLHSSSYEGATASNGTGRLIAIALPYGGATTTIAPKGAAGTTFTLKPVPNILATDLTYAPYGNENKYEFSFNVNTKPELAQIRFYANETDMLANNNNYAFYYQFPDGDCKQGRMSVIFDAVGGTIENKLLTDPNGNGHLNLPRGEYYWNVYVKTRESNVFAPIYTQNLSDFKVDQGDYSDDPHRQHATVDNNPNNKGFGHIYVADHHNIADKNSRKHYVRAYTIGNAIGNAQQDNQSNINDNTRYTTHWQVINTTAHYTRRPAVAPDGMVYITDEGTNGGSVPTLITYGFNGAGMWVLDPNRQNNGGDVQWISPNFSTKEPNQEVVTALSFLLKGENWYIYKTNTYSEIEIHGPKDKGGTGDLTNNVSWQKNGYRIYQLAKISGLLKHYDYDDAQSVAKPFGGGNDTYKCGDTNGQFSIIATEYGVWMCQNREGKVVANDSKDNPDGINGVALSFFNHDGTRTFTSTAQSALTQKTNSPLQSTPGAGMAYQKRDGVEYLYLVNHAGNILEFKITGGATPTLTHTQTYVTGNDTKGVKYGAISSMNFDYAGNLVVTAGATYGVNGTDVNGNAVVRDHQELVIYTMPYPNQENARAIPASEAFRFLPERVAQLDMDKDDLNTIIEEHGGHGCAIDLYRPLQGGMFNTICLPFTLDLTALPEDHPLKNATLKQYTGLNLNTIGGEKVLELVFTDVSNRTIIANEPYIIQPENDNGVPHIISFDGPLVLTSTTGGFITKSDTEDDKTYSITHQGIVPYQPLEPKYDPTTGESLTLILVADNRLAVLTGKGDMYGFRGYFQLNQPLPRGMQTRITTSKGTTTNTTIAVDGKKVNVEKFLREGRVYIRMGESLYTVDGQKVE